MTDLALRRELAEWATPALYLRGTPQPLYDLSAPSEELESPPEPRLAPGIVVRKVGEFVGRRREQRLLHRTLRDTDRAGVLLQGIGGVGKSALAANALQRLSAENWLLVSVFGRQSASSLLEAIGSRLFTQCVSEGRDAKDPERRIAVYLKQREEKWEDRYATLSDELLRQRNLLLLLDNFEDNLDQAHRLKDPELAELLGLWLRNPGRSRLLITCRYGFPLPDDAQEQLEVLPLGPLSWAETRKLVWRLPGLDALSAQDLGQAWRQVGGHPRALEYLDALLRGGHARFSDIEQRLKKALRQRGIQDPKQERWYLNLQGQLDQALAETVTLATDDVLLDALLARLDQVPLAWPLLLGASVYQRPVDKTALHWQVGTERYWPDFIHRVVKANPNADWGELQPIVDFYTAPPIGVPENFEEAAALLVDLGLLSLMQLNDDTPASYIVHRWTAAGLVRRAEPTALREAHRRAAHYWRWRVEGVPGSRQRDIEDGIETRYHLYQAGDIDAAAKAPCATVACGLFGGVDTAVKETEWICDQLHTWGHWRREDHLYQETLGWLPANSSATADFLNKRGGLAQACQDYDQAADWYRQALAINKAIDNQTGMADTLNRLANVAQDRHNYDEALDWYHQSLSICEALSNRYGIATIYGNIGIVAHARGEYDQAVEWYHRSLAVFEEIDDKPGIARCYDMIGTVVLEHHKYDQAMEWHNKALAIFQEIDDRPGTANCHAHIAIVAKARGDYDQALQEYRQSLAIFNKIEDPQGMADIYNKMGAIAQARGDYEPALDNYRQALILFEELGQRARIADTYLQMGHIARISEVADGDYSQALEWYQKALDIYEALADRNGMFKVYGWLGNVAGSRGEKEKANEWFKKSLLVGQDLDNRLGRLHGHTT